MVFVWLIVGLVGAALLHRLAYVFGKGVGRGISDGLKDTGFLKEK